MATCLAGNVSPSRVMAASLLNLAASPDPAQTNSSFTLTASVSGSGPTPTGTVTFDSNLCPQPCARPTGTIGTAALDSSGKATLRWPGFSTPGPYSFGARFAGDSNDSPSSGTVTQVVAAPVPMLPLRGLIALGLLIIASGILLLQNGNG